MILSISRLTRRGRVFAAAAIACAAIGVPAVALAASSAHSGPAVKACKAAQTYVWFALAPNGAAGTIYYPIEFTNTGATCTLRGFPGVAAVGKTGHQLGKRRPVPGDSAHGHPQARPDRARSARHR